HLPGLGGRGRVSNGRGQVAAPLVGDARRVEGVRELVGRLADEVRTADARAEFAGEWAEVLALHRTAEDEPERRVIRRDAAAGGGRVRRLRVVDVANA